MDMDALINAICAKVLERITASTEKEAQVPVETACVKKPSYLILASDHGTTCHETLEDEILTAHLDLKCAALQEGELKLEDYEGVIAFGLTNEALAKIAMGILDTPYTNAFGKAILSGKKIYLLKEEIELYNYKDTAPKGYYKKFDEYLNFLKQNGVEVVEKADLQKAILGAPAPEVHAPTADVEEVKAQRAAKEVIVKKKVITERDLISARAEGATILAADTKSIITDLAKDFAARYGIVIERRNGIK